MTTKVVIVNDSDSNPGQHAEVTFQEGTIRRTTKLAPGESVSAWIAGATTLEVREIGEPKPKG